ncbi:SRPBCC domain-containing protein [Saccharothrix isguenensis]
MTDITDVLDDTRREIVTRRIAAGEVRAIRIRRHFDARPEEVWHACTDPARIGRWFNGVSGDLRQGGSYQMELGVSGDILHCEPSTRLVVTWAYGDRGADEVELRLAPDGDGTELVLEHAAVNETAEMDGRLVDVILNDADSGANGQGAGWELGLVLLDKHLHDEQPEDPGAWEESPEALELADRSGAAWAATLGEYRNARA